MKKDPSSGDPDTKPGVPVPWFIQTARSLTVNESDEPAPSSLLTPAMPSFLSDQLDGERRRQPERPLTTAEPVALAPSAPTPVPPLARPRAKATPRRRKILPAATLAPVKPAKRKARPRAVTAPPPVVAAEPPPAVVAITPPASPAPVRRQDDVLPMRYPPAVPGSGELRLGPAAHAEPDRPDPAIAPAALRKPSRSRPAWVLGGALALAAVSALALAVLPGPPASRSLPVPVPVPEVALAAPVGPVRTTPSTRLARIAVAGGPAVRSPTDRARAPVPVQVARMERASRRQAADRVRTASTAAPRDDTRSARRIATVAVVSATPAAARPPVGGSTPPDTTRSRGESTVIALTAADLAGFEPQVEPAEPPRRVSVLPRCKGFQVYRPTTPCTNAPAGRDTDG